MVKKIDFSENRNAFMPSLAMKKKLLESIKSVFEYPDYKNVLVNEAISNYFNVSIENTSVTNGSMEAINLLVQVLSKKDVSLFKPTFWGYENALNRFGYNVSSYKLDNNFTYNINDMNKVAKKSELMFVCNPNNPTLDSINKKDLLELIEKNPNCHFIVDETMLIFDKEFEKKSICNNVENLDNLSVIISFSKFLGIAGLRTGVVFSNTNVIEKVKEQMIPYSFGIIQQQVLPVALQDKEYIEKTKDLIEINRNKLIDFFESVDCVVINHDTNFILVKLPIGVDANLITKKLSENNIIVRNIKEAYPELEGDWIRVSINTQENNDILINNFKSILDSYKCENNEKKLTLCK